MNETTNALLITAVLLLALAELVSIIVAILLLTSIRRLIHTWQAVLDKGQFTLDKVNHQLTAGLPWMGVLKWGLHKFKQHKG